MRHHAVVGAHGEPVDVPGAHHGLPGLRLGEQAAVTQGLHGAGELGDGGHVGQEEPARGQGLGGGLDVLPGGEHVQDHPVDAAGFHLGGNDVGEVSGAQLPGGMVAAEPGVDVGGGDLGEVLTALDGQQVAGLPDGGEQVHGQCTGADAGLQDAGAGEDVPHGDDLSGVLGVDHLGAAGHGQDVVGQERAQQEQLVSGVGLDDAALVHADDVPVVEGAAHGLEVAVRVEQEGVLAALGVGDLDAFAVAEGAPATGLPQVLLGGGALGGLRG